MGNLAVTSTQQPEIPDKLYFRIGDVAKIAQVKPFVLRFWETEFPQLGPKKSGTGHRLYRRKDVELVLEIKRLLYEERFTIEGARNLLATRSNSKIKTQAPAAVPEQIPMPLVTTPASVAAATGLDDIRRELRSLLDLLV
jgi:DNA-binding transcriptional MerR regulator